VPRFVHARWEELCDVLDEPFPGDKSASSRIGLALLELLSIGDEACQYLVRHYGSDANESPSFTALLRARQILKRNSLMSMCDEIAPSRLKVLPKYRTPQEGLTIRSLSLYAGVIEGNEVAPYFRQARFREDSVFNVLIVPWPLILRPTDFLESEPLPGEMGNMSPSFGYFTVGRVPPSIKSVVEQILTLIDDAIRDVGKIGAVVLPELALPKVAGLKLAMALNAREIELIAGCGTPAIPGKSHGTNEVLIAITGAEAMAQKKHHRWKLDSGQIRQYSLGSQFDPSRTWWEHIDLGSRELWFTQIQSWLSTCVLICEDLARPDPAGDVVRAVGPSLTIALLMDGPQTRVRWGARHATTLAEDPGCSVLTITSLGMSQMSRPHAGQSDRSRVVALWKEEDHDFVEVELPPGKDAAVLSLTIKKCLDWAADGRSRSTGVPSLSGIRYFQMADASVNEEVSLQ